MKVRKRNDLEAVEIHGIAAGGAGVGRLSEGRAIFVHRTAPGDHVRVEVTDRRTRWARGRLVRVGQPSNQRRAPACQFYEFCGGCTLQHLTYPAQLAWKRRIIVDALKRIGHMDVPVGEVRSSPRAFRYRTRATVHLRRLGGARVVAGFHELDRPGRILNVDGGCLVLHEALADVWDGVRQHWGAGASRLPSGDRLDMTFQRVRGGAILIVRGGKGEGSPEQLLRLVPGLRGIWQSRSGGGLELLAGDPHPAVAWDERLLRIRPGAFVQGNPEAFRALVDDLVAAAGEVHGQRVVDAYAGIGVYAHALADRGATVTMIERDPMPSAAVSAVEGELPLFVRGTVEEHLPSALPADLLILNPPRTGLDASVSASIRDQPPRRVFYVSCNPATLARDLGRLSEHYTVDRVTAYDLFPQTSHVETLAILSRKND